MRKNYIVQIIKTDYATEEETIFEYEDEFDDEKMTDGEIAVQLLETALHGCTDED